MTATSEPGIAGLSCHGFGVFGEAFTSRETTSITGLDQHRLKRALSIVEQLSQLFCLAVADAHER